MAPHHTCCALRRDILEECAGFDEGLLRGVDSELFVRVRATGHRLVLAPRTWAVHRPPATFGRWVAKHFHYGVGYADDVQRHPERAAGRHLRTRAPTSLCALVAAHTLLPYSHSERSWRPGFKLRAVTSYAAAVGYVYGWYRHPYSRSG